MSTDAGHVFVIKGNVRNLACDVYLQSTDRDLGAGGTWLRMIPDAAGRLDPRERAEFQAEQVFAIPVHVADSLSPEATPVLTAVPYYGVTHADLLRERVRHFFLVADRVVHQQNAAGRRMPRERPLVALPMFGHRGGGGGPVQGDILRVLYDEARSATSTYGFDVALVVPDPRTYDLAQVIRRDIGRGWPALSADELQHAQRLATDATRGRLVPFMGSGISVSAGAPTWAGLITALALAADVPDDTTRLLAESQDVLDQAEYLHKEFNSKHPESPLAFAQAVIDAVNMPRYGLGPALLASLTAEQAITLNYDRLFEMAASDAGLERRVIPGDATGGDRWLLKLHGSVETPESIVLTRDHYLRYSTDRDSLTSLAKATLMTRRLLFVGFGMTDTHFHEIAHDVRRARPNTRGQRTTFGTVLTLTDSEVTRKLWEGELEFIHLAGARQLDIFLDAIMAHACDGHSYVLADGYATTLPPAEAALRGAVDQMLTNLTDAAKGAAAWPRLEAALRELGWDGRRRREGDRSR